jgi:hypothetical protein
MREPNAPQDRVLNSLDWPAGMSSTQKSRLYMLSRKDAVIFLVCIRITRDGLCYDADVSTVYCAARTQVSICICRVRALGASDSVKQTPTVEVVSYTFSLAERPYPRATHIFRGGQKKRSGPNNGRHRYE